MSLRNQTIRFCAAVVLPLVVAVALVARPLGGCFLLASGVQVEGWISPAVRGAYPLMLAVAALACVLLFRLAVNASESPSGFSGITKALSPFAFAPLLPLLSFAAPWIGRDVAGLFIPLGFPAIAAVALARIVPLDIGTGRRGMFKSLAIFSVVGAVGIFILWLPTHGYFHDGGGDSKSYALQAKSLVESNTVELTGFVEDAMRKAGGVSEERKQAFLRGNHIKENAEGRYYSFHSFGLPLLSWPFIELLGETHGKLATLLLLAALAAAGCRCCCHELGIPDLAADIATLFMLCSQIWAFTALTFMPEMMGFALSAWAFWAVLAEGDPRRRIAATIVSAMACSALPYAHVRFTPCAMLLFGFFGIEGLLIKDERFLSRKLPRLGLCAITCVAAWLVLLRCHANMYSGTEAYDYDAIIASYPIAAWAMFSDAKGLVAVFPLVWWYATAAMGCLFRRDAIARKALYAVALVAATLLFCCTTEASLYGDCFAGRYLFTAMPFLMPFAAMSFARGGRIGRAWFAFLGFIPVMYLFFVTPFAGGYASAPEPMWTLEPFQNLWRPFTAFLFEPGSPRNFFGTVFAAILIAATATMSCFARRKWAGGTAIALIVTAIPVGFLASPGNPVPPRARGWILRKDFGWRYYKGGASPATDFFSSFDPEDSSFGGNPFLIMADTQPDDPQNARHVVLSSSLHANDPLRRPHRWKQIRFQSVDADMRGGIAFRVSGTVERGAARLCATRGREFIMESETCVGEGAFDCIFLVPAYPGSGSLNISVALDGAMGEIRLTRFALAPYVPGLEDAAGAFPSEATIVAVPMPR